jgi:ubiquinone/menaquinone biosynthesis C-methylase UbiE
MTETDPFAALTARQQRAWSTGDFHQIGVSQILAGEQLAHRLHIHAGERVLDVAGGAGNAALSAARRYAEVVCTDYVPDLLEHAQRRAAIEGLAMVTQVADAQALPFPDGSFDVVVSTFGVMFAPDHRRCAAEIIRVLRPGGRVGLANWTPESFVGQQFLLLSRYLPPTPGANPPPQWGVETYLRQLFGESIASLTVRLEGIDFVATSTAALFERFRSHFGPVMATLTNLDENGRREFTAAWLDLAERHNIATDGTLEFPSAYLEVIAVKR